MSYRKRPIDSADLLQDANGALIVSSGQEGRDKPDILTWLAGSDSWSQADSGAVGHEASIVFIRVGAGGALVSIDDETGQERPFIIPPNYWREIVVSGGIPAGARIVAKNLTAGANFTDLYVEVR